MKTTLAEALLRRKELQGKVSQLEDVRESHLFEVVVQRRNVSESVDDVVAKVPRVSSEQIAAAFDWHARQLRLIDAVIQQCNWTTEIDVPDSTFGDYSEREDLKETRLPLRGER